VGAVPAARERPFVSTLQPLQALQALSDADRVCPPMVAYRNESSAARYRHLPVAAARDLSPEQKLLEGMPCRAWTIMPENTFGGGNRNQVEVDQWTVKSVRQYAKLTVDLHYKGYPKAADGSDVEDRRVIEWIARYCVYHPEDPFVKAMFFLTMTFITNTDHSNLPPPP
jgi:hypothetical protein